LQLTDTAFCLSVLLWRVCAENFTHRTATKNDKDQEQSL